MVEALPPSDYISPPRLTQAVNKSHPAELKTGRELILKAAAPFVEWAQLILDRDIEPLDSVIDQADRVHLVSKNPYAHDYLLNAAIQSLGYGVHFTDEPEYLGTKPRPEEYLVARIDHADVTAYNKIRKQKHPDDMEFFLFRVAINAITVLDLQGSRSEAIVQKTILPGVAHNEASHLMKQGFMTSTVLQTANGILEAGAGISPTPEDPLIAALLVSTNTTYQALHEKGIRPFNYEHLAGFMNRLVRLRIEADPTIAPPANPPRARSIER